MFINLLKKVFIAVGVIFFALNANATHNRAGEITYRHLQGLTYEVLITTYTKASALADRPVLYLRWGDENGLAYDSLDRESIDILIGDIQVNTYIGSHTYGGPGAFELKVEDPNRNEGVLNMVGSVDTPFAIRSLLIIDPEAGHNNSVRLLNPATENACLNREWIHNPAAFDEDGDLLTFSLVPCRGFNGDPIPTYIYPDEVSNNDDTFEIDQFTGDVTWDSPQIVGEYNIAIRVEEWREVAGELRKVGEVVRDMQIDVQVCSNQPPEVSAQTDTCIVAGSFLTWFINASDPDGDNITLNAVGGPISEVLNPAVFTNLGGGIGEFAWAPSCAEVRLAPYQIIFKATDQGTAIPLTDISTAYVRVVAPAVENVIAEAVGNTVLLGWTGGECSENLESWQLDAGYHDVYRKLDPDEWTPTVCETGVPQELGYELIASLPDLGETGYVDEDLLSFGATYCYRIVMRFQDGSESLASDDVCATIVKDVPVMTHAGVVVTDDVEGVVNVGWSPPTEMDTLAFTGPYFYKVYNMDESGVYVEISTIGPSSTSPMDILALDSTFIHIQVNTESEARTYKVEAWSGTAVGDQIIGESIPARTPFLTLIPNDNRIELELKAIVPWSNTIFYLERKGPLDLDFNPLDTVEVGVDITGVIAPGGGQAFPIYQTFLYEDKGLINGAEYCYRVVSEGHYDATGIETPLLNAAQTVCATPYDFTPPCPPTLQVIPDCPQEVDFISWSEIDGCADDIMGYILYWTPFEGDSLQPYAYFDNEGVLGLDTTFIFNEDGEEGSIAGCFAVTALDSLNLGPDGEFRRNESAFSNIVCVDNCPFYFLPNVFSPNHDNMNDLFQAFQWKFVDRVDFVINNRWGIPVFTTHDPDVNWDGTHFETGEIMPDGVYYYTAIVYTRRLEGIVPEKFSGNLHLVGGRGVIVE
jgi:gliding motility-associated-like protein